MCDYKKRIRSNVSSMQARVHEAKQQTTVDVVVGSNPAAEILRRKSYGSKKFG